MVPYLPIILITLFGFGGLYIFYRFPQARKYIPFLQQLIETVHLSFLYWGVRKGYPTINTLARYTTFLEVVDYEKDILKSKAHVQAFVALSLYKYYKLRDLDHDKVKKFSGALYVLFAEQAELRDSLASFSDVKNLEVKRLTLLAIDVLGEFFTLSNDLDRDYFQHLIYGINKALVELRADGLTRKGIAKVSATLWRLYQITRAYSHQAGLANLTRAEFNEKVKEAIDSLTSAFSS